MTDNTHIPDTAEDDEISLLDLLQTIVDNLRLLIIGPLVVGLAALGISFAVPPTFTATVKFLPPQQQQSAAASMLASLGGLGGLAGAAAGLKNPADQYLAFLKSNDDIRNLQSMDATLKQEDQYIRSRFMQQQSSEYFVVQGRTLAELEQHEQQLLAELTPLQQAGKLDAVQALGQWVPSLEQQKHNIAMLQAIPQPALVEYAQALQLNTSDVLNWQAHLKDQPLLTEAVFKDHPLHFLQMSPTQRLVMLQNVHDVKAIQQLEDADVQLLRPVHQLSELFKQHRVQAQWLLLSALLMLAVGLGALYGKKSILPLVLPVSMALMTTFAIQAWLGVEINLFSIMGTFLIIGIGVDYAIFYRHGYDHPQVVGMALFLCMMSTFFSFGLLSFSHTYAIHSFGLTVLLGVIFSFIYATLFTSSDAKHVVVQQYQPKS